MELTQSPRDAVVAPEEALAELFGDADRIRVTLWIDRGTDHEFSTDRCAATLDLPEPAVRTALRPLRRLGMVGYHAGLYARVEHPLWKVVAASGRYAGSTRATDSRRPANASGTIPKPRPTSGAVPPAAVFHG
jgi:hypothetical protein